MQKILIVLAGFVALFYTTQCITPKKSAKELAFIHFKGKADTLFTVIQQLADDAISQKSYKQLQHEFIAARRYYKQVELFTEYFFPATAKAMNGPALLEVEPDNPKYPAPPTGFQVVEENLFGDTSTIDRNSLLVDIKILAEVCVRLQRNIQTQTFSDEQIWDAARLELFRVIALGLSGFDSPIAEQSLSESAEAIEAVAAIIAFYRTSSNDTLFNQWNERIQAAANHLRKPVNLYAFDYLACIKNELNPACSILKQLQQAVGIPFIEEPRPLATNAATIFDSTAWEPWYYSNGFQKPVNHQPLASLGEKLFYDNKLSANGQRSCGSCHQPTKAFTDGLNKNISFDGKRSILRNTPSILFAAMQPLQFADSRVAYLEDQAKQAIENPEEMHGHLGKAVSAITKEKEYAALLQQAFGKQICTERDLQLAIAAYIRTKVIWNSQFDLYMNSQNSYIPKAAYQGFNLFMGKAKCGTCHFLPLFNGVVPPLYLKMESEVLGVPAVNKPPYQIDPDKGKYQLVQSEPYRFAFKTTTVRNSGQTGPYMHNGVFATLAELIDFYNKGGGAGLGIDLPNQTLPDKPLNLTNAEKQDLIAFIQSLSIKE